MTLSFWMKIAVLLSVRSLDSYSCIKARMLKCCSCKDSYQRNLLPRVLLRNRSLSQSKEVQCKMWEAYSFGPNGHPIAAEERLFSEGLLKGDYSKKKSGYSKKRTTQRRRVLKEGDFLVRGRESSRNNWERGVGGLYILEPTVRVAKGWLCLNSSRQP